jgi:nifR3 family TIM-barrel protein
MGGRRHPAARSRGGERAWQTLGVTSSTVTDARPLKLGPHEVWPPVVLAPMAGITNIAFRRLCREFGAGVYVCEMITTIALVERNPKTNAMIAFDPDEQPRSLQLYGVDPETVGKAVRRVVDENLADHIDLNFGCPVPKVTRRGGGAALPWRRRLYEKIVRTAVVEAGELPVTVKFRKGIDDTHLTYLDAGRIAEDAGVAYVALHARTAAQRYSGTADWDSIGALKAHLSIPVLGNGDIWEGEDALRMMAQTGADGVVIGRGCLGRPWLFADLAAAFDGETSRRLPKLGEVIAMMNRHAALLVQGFQDERHGCADFRKHVTWYLKGFPVGSEVRAELSMVTSLAQLADLLGKLDPEEPFPTGMLGQPRGRTNAPGKVLLPYGWLEDRDDLTVPEGAEPENSGG